MPKEAMQYKQLTKGDEPVMNPLETVRRYDVSVTLNVSVVVTVEGPEDMEELRDCDYNLTDAIVVKQLIEDIQNGEASFDLTVDDAWPTQEVTA